MIKVLFVDDEMIVRVALKSMVDWSTTEFTIVDAVSDGQAALDAVDRLHPQIIVTDLRMPGMDGIELAKNLEKRGYPGKLIVLSGYGEFNLARDAMRYGAVDYLLKADFTGESLLASLRKAASNLPADLTEEQISSSDCFTTEDALAALRGKEILNKTYSKRYMLLYVFKKGATKKGFENVSGSSTREMLAGILSENSGEFSATIPLSENTALLIFPISGTGSISAAQIQRTADAVMSVISVYMNTLAGAVLSQSFSCSSEFASNLRACVQAARLCLYKGFGTVIKQEESALFSHNLPDDILSEITHACAALTESNYSCARKTISDSLNHLRSRKVCVDAAEMYIKRLFENITISYSFYFDHNKERLSAFAIRYKRCGTIEDYNQLAVDMIDEISVSSIKSDNTHYRHEVNQIICYIKENLDKKLTLTELSTAVNMTTSYVSRLFKNETGMNLNTYINMLKMEKAMELLKQPEVFVKEVAAELGYEDQSYFSRIFNKYLGITPIEFKSRLLGSE